MATIRVMLVTCDNEYSDRIGQYMSRHHSDIKLSILDSPSNINQMMTMNSFSIILVESEFSDYPLSLSGRSAVAYLSDSDAQNTLNDKKVFCKYQNGETLYRLILDLFSEVSSTASVSNISGMVYAFLSASGGAGATTLAIAFAKRLAAGGSRTIYINFDKFFDSAAFLSGESIGNMSDLIFAAISAERSRNSINLSAKASALICKDQCGVDFIQCTANPYDCNDLNDERLNAIYNALVGDPPYDAVVLDIQPQNEMQWELMLSKAGRIFIVSENKTSSAMKLSRLVQFIRACDSHIGGISAKAVIIMNRDKSTEWQREVCGGIPFIGSVPKYGVSDGREITDAVMKLEMWDR